MICWNWQSFHWMQLYIVHMDSLHSKWFMDRNPLYPLTMLSGFFVTVRFMLLLSWSKYIMLFRQVFKVNLKLPIGQWPSHPIGNNDMLSFLCVIWSVSSKHIPLPQGYTYKLAQNWFCPFEINKFISPEVYHVGLPPMYRQLHPVFHAS